MHFLAVVDLQAPALTDFILMVEGTSNMFITGPRVVKEAIGQVVSMDDLGGTETHSIMSGMADFVAQDDRLCIAYIKKLLSYLPDNYRKRPNVYKVAPFNMIKNEKINDIVPISNRQAFDTHDVIKCLTDEGSIMEMKEKYAPNIITTLARIGGHPVGIIANQSFQKAGCIDIDAADKAAGFIRITSGIDTMMLVLRMSVIAI